MRQPANSRVSYVTPGFFFFLALSKFEWSSNCSSTRFQASKPPEITQDNYKVSLHHKVNPLELHMNNLTF